MLTENTIAEALLLCQNKLKAVQAMAQLMTEWATSLTQEETALRSLNQVAHDSSTFEGRFREAQLSLPGMGLPETVNHNAARARRKGKGGKKPDVQIIEDIFREYGPLHVTNLVPVGQSKGISFRGSKKATLMARDKMYSSKRFQLFGNNVWGLPGQELPEGYRERISGNKSSGSNVHEEAEQPEIRIVA